MTDFEKDDNITHGKGEAEIDWITVNGAHIPIRDGEKLQKAVRNLSENNLIKNRKNGIVNLPKQEYAEFCSAIRTRYADKIPSTGTMLHGNNYYKFTYSKAGEQILCKFKIPIVGNEDKIKYMEERNANRNRKTNN